MTYRVAIIGLGNVAWRGWSGTGLETHVDGVDSCSETWLSVACDDSEAVRAEFSAQFAGVPVVREAKIAATQADIVAVCTPVESHLPIIEQIVEIPSVRAIICEKPLAPTVAEAEEIVRICKDRVLVVGHQRRYEGAHRATQRFIDGGSIGHILAASAFFPGDYLSNGSHAADLCRFFVGDSVPWTIRQVESGFGIMVAGDSGSVMLESYGHLRPGYMGAMYQDVVNCLRDPKRVPQCAGTDGIEAVRHALYAQERDANV